MLFLIPRVTVSWDDIGNLFHFPFVSQECQTEQHISKQQMIELSTYNTTGPDAWIQAIWIHNSYSRAARELNSRPFDHQSNGFTHFAMIACTKNSLSEPKQNQHYILDMYL